MTFRSFPLACLVALFLLFSLSVAQETDPLVSPEVEDPTPTPSSAAATLSVPVPFLDVTNSVGISQRAQSEQFGGATIADLDGDGNYDFILTYHTYLRVFYGTGSGTFTGPAFSIRNDIHGVSVAQRTTRSTDKLMTLSVGGGRGTNLRAPFVFLTKPDRTFTDVTMEYGFGLLKSRGRVAVFMDMSLKSRLERRRNKGGPDVLFINLLGSNPDLIHFPYQNQKGNYSLMVAENFERVNEERAIVTDIDNDGVMELVHYSILKIFKVAAPFNFQDITMSVIPGLRNLRRSVSSCVELDFNNDGWMDLYIGRAQSNLVTPRGPASVSEFADVLLMNDKGVYKDVSTAMGVPVDTNSMGVSAEDFNNDGHVDIIITTFEGPDFLLLNDKGKGFTRVALPIVPRTATTRGNNVMAMDYDLDGRVDFIVGQGFRKAFLGKYHLLKNQLPLGPNTNYLLVRVGNEFTRACTSLNAVVTVFLGRGQKLTRRVGGRGAMAGGQSYIDTVHFGLGSITIARRVVVKWTSGGRRAMLGVAANQMVSFGKDLPA